jgi:hypothetical protein
MADVVKKVIVENVPKVYNSGYTIRYRIVSEDKNRTSHWSPMHTFERPPEVSIPTIPDSVDGEIVFLSNRQISASWAETNTNSIYEIFLKWDFEDNYANDLVGWNYIRTVSSPTYSTLVPLNPPNPLTGVPAEAVKIWVQQPTATKQYTPMAKIFTQEGTLTS